MAEGAAGRPRAAPGRPGSAPACAAAAWPRSCSWPSPSPRPFPAERGDPTPTGPPSWLESVQNADGGFGASPGDGSSAAMTGWAMLGLEAAGRQPARRLPRRQHPGRLPARQPVDEIESTGDLARTILALEGAGVEPRSFAGRDLVAELAKRRRDNGSFEGWPGDTAFAIIALRTAGATGGLDQSLAWLRKVQNDDGGWGDTPGSPSTADGTGAVLQALSAGSKAAEPRPLLPARGPAPRRRLPARRLRRGQLPVDRLGGPGHHRRRRRPGLASAAAAPAPPTTSPPSRQATATTATPPPATRPRSG